MNLISKNPIDLTQAAGAAIEVIDRNCIAFVGVFPDTGSLGNVYPIIPARHGLVEGSNYGWTTGFWSGLLWLAYELSGEPKFLQAAASYEPNFKDRMERRVDVDHHDLGFLYSLSSVACWRLTGSKTSRQTAILAAETLMERYLPGPGIFQAWGAMDDLKQRGRTIIDSLMNMPLLYWAAEETGKNEYAEAAHRHALVLSQAFIRADNTTFHTFYFDPESSAPLYGKTAQGAADNSCWARGQAWGIYGFILNYAYSRDENLLHAACRLADYFIDKLPGDQVVYWDLIFGDGSGEPRDSSAAAIAVCGLLEIAKWLPEGERRRRYQTAAQAILASLVDNYFPWNQPQSNALLLHAVGSKPVNSFVDEALIFGDYFYLEAILRMLRPDWKMYW